MSYTSFTAETRVAEAQDATGFRIWDNSTWNGESAITTYCVIKILLYLVDGSIIEYDDYELITGADTTKFDEYLDIDGHTIETSDLTVDGVAADERFVDGYYVIRTVYSDGTYVSGSEPYYDNVQAFLAKARCKARKLPTKLSWPMTDAVYLINRDIFLLRMYLDAAEDAADLGKENQFRNLINIVDNIYSSYAIENCF